MSHDHDWASYRVKAARLAGAPAEGLFPLVSGRCGWAKEIQPSPPGGDKRKSVLDWNLETQLFFQMMGCVPAGLQFHSIGQQHGFAPSREGAQTEHGFGP